MIHISPSILSGDFSHLGADIAETEKAGADYLHIDVMDGHFVPNISFGVPIVKSIRSKSNQLFDVHLMIDDPKKYAADFAKAGADLITFHYEAVNDQKDVIEYIRSLGKKVGISIKPKTPAFVLEPLLPLVDLVLIMTVEPGFGGQSLIPETIENVKQVKASAARLGADIDIEVDGGINLSNVETLVDAGANVIVAGSSIFGAENIGNAVKEFLKLNNIAR